MTVREYHQDWQGAASCAGVGSFLFFSDETRDGSDTAPANGGGSVRQARAICGSCPVWRECRFVGLAEPSGMWGGTTARQRAVVRADVGMSKRLRHPDAAERVVAEMRDRLNRTEGDVDEALARWYPDTADRPYWHTFEYRTITGRAVSVA